MPIIISSTAVPRAAKPRAISLFPAARLVALVRSNGSAGWFFAVIA